MTAAAPKSEANRSKRPFFSSGFFGGLIALILTLIAAGISGFMVLTANSPLALLQGGDRPIAAATAFVPASSPFTLSLLTQPDKLVALQRAILQEKGSNVEVTASQKGTQPGSKPAKQLTPQQQAVREVDQLKQSLLTHTGLDYEHDIRPWIGNEVTFALTDADLDRDRANGEQAGYLVAVEIAADQQQQARECLQLFWQRQALAGKSPRSEQTSGVRILYGDAATALVGDQFVIFANDVRVLRRSIRAAQSVTNLAQNRAYRQSVAQLPEDRLGLAYLDMALLNGANSNGANVNGAKTTHSFVAVGLGITRTGITAAVRFADAAPANLSTASAGTLAKSAAANRELSPSIEPKLIGLLKFLPANTPLALVSKNLSQLAPTLTAAGLSSTLPDFFQLEAQSGGQLTGQPASGNQAAWDWVKADYALGKIGAGKEGDWLLAIAPKADQRAAGIAQLDASAKEKGYIAVPVAIGDDQAIAWTRLKKSGRATHNSLETEILGLRLQQGEYEILASSLAAMEAAMAAGQNSLLATERFTQAIASLPPTDSGYLYANWSAVEPALSQVFPALKRIKSVARPLVSHLDALAATREGQAASVFIRLAQ